MVDVVAGLIGTGVVALAGAIIVRTYSNRQRGLTSPDAKARAGWTGNDIGGPGAGYWSGGGACDTSYSDSGCSGGGGGGD